MTGAECKQGFSKGGSRLEFSDDLLKLVSRQILSLYLASGSSHKYMGRYSIMTVGAERNQRDTAGPPHPPVQSVSSLYSPVGLH